MAASLPEIPPKPSPGSDQDKLIWALKTILLMLHAIVGEERLFPAELRGLFLETWSGVVKSVGDTVEIILFSYEGLDSSLTPIGLTGKSLALEDHDFGDVSERTIRHFQSASRTRLS